MQNLLAVSRGVASERQRWEERACTSKGCRRSLYSAQSKCADSPNYSPLTALIATRRVSSASTHFLGPFLLALPSSL